MTGTVTWPTDTHGVDAAAWDSCLGRYINDNFVEDTHNCKLSRWKEQWVVVALRDIEPDEELFMAYGRDFWAQRMIDLPLAAQQSCALLYGISTLYPQLSHARRAGAAAQPQGGILMVAASTEPQGGEGLFAATLFPAGAELGAYTGLAISWLEANQEQYVSDYIFGDPRGGRAVDAVALDSCYARYANDGFDRSSNAEITWADGEQWPTLYATRESLPREEILIAYGKEYWSAERRFVLGQEGRVRCRRAYGLCTESPLPTLPLDPCDADGQMEGSDDAVGGDLIVTLLLDDVAFWRALRLR